MRRQCAGAFEREKDQHYDGETEIHDVLRVCKTGAYGPGPDASCTIRETVRERSVPANQGARETPGRDFMLQDQDNQVSSQNADSGVRAQTSGRTRVV